MTFFSTLIARAAASTAATATIGTTTASVATAATTVAAAATAAISREMARFTTLVASRATVASATAASSVSTAAAATTTTTVRAAAAAPAPTTASAVGTTAAASSIGTTTAPAAGAAGAPLNRTTIGPGDIDGLGAAVVAVLDVELDLLAVAEAAEAAGALLDPRVVNEQIVAAVVGGDEAEPLLVVEPLDGAAHLVAVALHLIVRHVFRDPAKTKTKTIFSL